MIHLYMDKSNYERNQFNFYFVSYFAIRKIEKYTNQLSL